jgi:DNA-binding NtrC family response regulator
MRLTRKFDFSTFTILLFVESEFARQLLTDMCRSLHVQAVISKRDYTSAWDAFKANPVDIVIGDIDSERGLQFLKDARDIEKSPNALVPFIVTSIKSSVDCVASARDDGATEFLKLPLSAVTLLKRIVYVVEQPRVFVKVNGFFGPDRRRQQRTYKGADRRQSPPAAADSPASESTSGAPSPKIERVAT